MSLARQAVTIAGACFRPRSPGDLAGVVAWAAYLAWVANGLVERLGTTAYIHLLFAVAVLGAWLGGCAARARRWPNARLVPGYLRATNLVTAGVAVAGFACVVVAGWFAGLALWPLATVGVLALTASAFAGLLVPGSGVYLLIGMWTVAIFAPGWGPDVVPPLGGYAVAAVACALPFIWAFATVGVGSARSVLGHPRSPHSWSRLLWSRVVWEPSLVRVTGVFGLLAVVAAVVQGVFGTDLKDESWLVLIGTLCVNTGATGASVGSPRGPLAGASWLLLLGAADRGGLGRRVQWRVLGGWLAGAAVFAVMVVVMGVGDRLLSMLLLGLACSSAYLAFASRIRWLLSSRLSGTVATPIVVAMVLVVWEYGSWSLPTALAAWVVGGAIAVLAGGKGIGRLDLDFGLTRD